MRPAAQGKLTPYPFQLHPLNFCSKNSRGMSSNYVVHSPVTLVTVASHFQTSVYGTIYLGVRGLQLALIGKCVGGRRFLNYFFNHLEYPAVEEFCKVCSRTYNALVASLSKERKCSTSSEANALLCSPGVPSLQGSHIIHWHRQERFHSPESVSDAGLNRHQGGVLEPDRRAARRHWHCHPRGPGGAGFKERRHRRAATPCALCQSAQLAARWLREQNERRDAKHCCNQCSILSSKQSVTLCCQVYES